MFIVKYAANEAVNRYKAKLIAKKFTQIYEIDYEKIFASTLRTDSLRILFALMTLKDMKAEQIDVNNAFIESDLEKVIYMHPSKEMTLKNERILKLLRNLYDLKQSARK